MGKAAAAWWLCSGVSSALSSSVGLAQGGLSLEMLPQRLQQWVWMHPPFLEPLGRACSEHRQGFVHWWGIDGGGWGKQRTAENTLECQGYRIQVLSAVLPHSHTHRDTQAQACRGQSCPTFLFKPGTAAAALPVEEA